VSVQIGTPVPHANTPAWQTLFGVHIPLFVHATQVPALQTSFAPQVLPLAALPVVVQTDAPVAHDVVPTRHMFPPGVHGWLGVHALQLPPEQYRFMPHDAPLARDVVSSVHVAMPPPHASAPLWQGAVLGVQVEPAAHAMHTPALQTFPAVKQLVPSAMLPVVWQTEAPVAHEVVPVLHVVPDGVQALLAAHGLQAPALHTMSAPQVVPFATAAPTSTQVTVPPAHEIVPVWQAFAGVHAVPATHAMQLPPPQTLPDPHAVPSATLPLSAHSGLPVLHVVMPTRHGLVTVHAPPTLHAAQVPTPQTMSVPHVVPSGTAVAWSVHVGAPVLQSSLPTWQGLAGTHAAAFVHVAHMPLEHTMFVPQFLPSGSGPDCMHTATPVAHDVTPVWQGSFVGTQLIPSAHAAQLPPWHAIPVPHAVPSA
jgi:hypothetical protein